MACSCQPANQIIAFIRTIAIFFRRTMPRHSAPSEEYQRTFTFPPPDYHSPRDPAAPRRTETAKEILARSSAPEIRKLVETGQVASAAHIQEIPVATFVRDNRRALQWFVQRLANGAAARDASHQEAAWQLLQQFDALADFALALELQKIGLCDSTTSFGRDFGAGSNSVLLWGFRRVMEKYDGKKR